MFIGLDVFFDAYGELLHRTHINIPDELLMESIFLNTRIKINNKVLHFEDWTGKYFFVCLFVFKFVKDPVKDYLCVCANLNEFQENFHAETSFLKFYGCISTIQNYLRRNNIVIKMRTSLDGNKANGLVQYAPKGSKVFCNNLINKITSVKECTNRKNILHLEILSPKLFFSSKEITRYKV